MNKFVVTFLATISIFSPARGADVSGAIIAPDEQLLPELERIRNKKDVPEQVTNAINEYTVDRIEFEKRLLTENEMTLLRMRKEAEIAFWIAHLMLLAGVLLGIIEAFHAYSLRRRSRHEENMKLEVKLESIAIKNASFGILAMFASFGLYVIYLRFIYPTQSIGYSGY